MFSPRASLCRRAGVSAVFALCRDNAAWLGDRPCPPSPAGRSQAGIRAAAAARPSG
jgi:hypothetical protein